MEFEKDIQLSFCETVYVLVASESLVRIKSEVIITGRDELHKNGNLPE